MAANRWSPESVLSLEEARLAGPLSTILPLFGAGVLAALMRLPGLWLPMERDEGAYGYVASMWLGGALPYRDVFDHKPPLIYLLYMPALLAGVDDALSVRIWASLLFMLQLPLVFAIARRVWDHATASVATVIYAVAGSAFGLQGLIFNTEQALVLPALLALWALVNLLASDAIRWPIILGVALGLVTLIKPNAAPLILPLALLATTNARGHARNIFVAVACAAAPWLLVLGWWGLRGAFDALVFALVTYNRLYTLESLERWTASGLVDVVASLGPLLVCAVGGIGFAGWHGLRQRQGMVVVLWTAAFVVGALAGLRPYVHYYYPVVAGLALLAAPGVTVLVRRSSLAQTGIQRLAARLAPAVVLGVALVPYMLDNSRLVGLSPAEQAERLYGAEGKEYFGGAPAVAAYIKRITAPEERIHIWAAEPELYLLSDRRASSRYIYTYPLELVPGALDELLGDLRRRPPAVIALYRDARPAGFARFAAAHDYRRATTVAGYDIWTAPNTRAP